MLKASIVLATYCPSEERRELCERSFSEIHRTGISRDEYELIVVDNGGIHRHLIESLKADVVVTNSHNLGQAAALNEGIAITKSINLALMDDDLSYKDGWLKAGLNILYKYPAYVVSLREVKKIFITGISKKGHKYARKVGGCWIMRRSLLNKIGRFGVGYYDFGGLWTRNLIRGGHRFIVSKEPWIFHMGLGKSLSRKRNQWIKHIGAT